jgi:hypothetical protein
MLQSGMKTTEGPYIWQTCNSPQTEHDIRIDIKTFVLTDWVSGDLITLKTIFSSDNCADHLTKALPKTLFYRHTDTLMEDKPLRTSRSNYTGE